MKKFYKENRVFVILMGIALACIAIIVAIMAKYIISSFTNDKLGNRAEGIEDVRITEEMISDMEDTLLKNEKIKDVVINVPDLVILFDMDFQKDTSTADIKAVAQSCLEFFAEDYLNFYDINFIMTKSDQQDEEGKTYTIMGYKKKDRTDISWSNNAKE